jgi:ABC-type lipoprotein release transport system permease subunit
LLSFAGGILGLALGFVGMRALLAVSPAGLPHIGEDGSAIGVDRRLLAFTLTISLLTGILFGLFPALSASPTDLNSTLKESSNRSGTGFRKGKTRSLLVISEVSLALVLLIGAALLLRFLFGVKPWDLGVFVSVPLILSSVALLAIWLPARRASKLEPMQALRTE